MKQKGMAILLAGLVFCAGLLAGCGQKPVVETVAESAVSLENDGHEARLVVACTREYGLRDEVLREIAEKYRADFPHTEIEFRQFNGWEDLAAALEAGEQADILELDGEDLGGAVEQGSLLDLYEYIKAWDESPTLTQAARQAVGARGAEHAYLIPYDFNQKIMFYRADWFGEYNEGKKETDMAWCRSWTQVLKAAQQLGERGKLALAGKDKLTDTFNAILWSTISLGRVADPGAAYFTAKEETKSVFSLKLAADAAAQFREVMETVVLPEAADWTEEEALNAFLTGKAGMLLADRRTAEKLTASLGEEAWAAEGFPRGQSGAAVFTDEYVGWGVSARTEEPEIAAHFLTYLSNGDNNTHFAKECGTLPIHLDALDMEESLLDGERAVEMEMIRKGEWYQYAAEPVMYAAHDGWRELAEEQLRQFLAGGLSSSDLLKGFDEYWTKACAEEGKLWK